MVIHQNYKNDNHTLSNKRTHRSVSFSSTVHRQMIPLHRKTNLDDRVKVRMHRIGVLSCWTKYNINVVSHVHWIKNLIKKKNVLEKAKL